MDRKIETFQNFTTNESLRRFRGILKIPEILIEMVMSKIIDYVPRLGFLYDKLSAKIDTDSSISPSKVKSDPIKITLDDIKNEKIKKTLKLTGIFNSWNIYTFDRLNDNRQPIYITKDEIELGDIIYGERVSDHYVDSNYSSKKSKRYLKSKGVSHISEIEPQFWVVAAKKSDRHDKMETERQDRYDKKRRRELEKLVDEEISEASFTGRTRHIYGQWNNNPLIFKIIEADRIDLMKKVIDACRSVDGWDGVKELIHQAIDFEGRVVDYDKYSKFNDVKTPLKLAKSAGMKRLLESELDIY
jgi:hypothetical protein